MWENQLKQRENCGETRFFFIRHSGESRNPGIAPPERAASGPRPRLSPKLLYGATGGRPLKVLKGLPNNSHGCNPWKEAAAQQ